MKQLTMVTDEGEYEPTSSNPEPVTVTCPICDEVIEIPQYDTITRSEALRKHIEEWHAGYPSEFHQLMLHAIGDMLDEGGIVLDEARAKATSCECVEYEPSKYWCTSKGIVGALTDEQEKLYCNPRVIVERPGIEKRITSFKEAVKTCKAEIPPTNGLTRLETYLKCMSRELEARGVKA